YAAHQINLQPRVSLPETTPTLRWTGKVGDASAFLVWGSRAFVCDPTADELSSRAVPCVFLGFPPDAPGWRFYHPASRCVLSSQDVTFDDSVSYYRLFPYRTTSPPPPPLFLAPGTPMVVSLPPQGRAPSGVSQVDPAEPVKVAVDSGAESGGAAPAGAESEGAQSGRAEPSPCPPHFLSPPPVRSQSQLQQASPLADPSPYSGPTRGLTERREPESCPVSPASRAASPVRTARAGRVSRLPPVPSTHSMTLRPSTAPQHVPLPSPPASSLPDGPDPESDSLRAASPTVTRILATAVTDPLFESSAASALVAELVDFAPACRLDYAASLVAESVSASVCPPSVGGECALGTDVLEDR
ncbi:unnamed protein product, partial [Closterium sp. NIES-54]